MNLINHEVIEASEIRNLPKRFRISYAVDRVPSAFVSLLREGSLLRICWTIRSFCTV